MHFGKSFEQVLVTLPEEYQERVIDYKKVARVFTLLEPMRSRCTLA